MQDFRTAHEAGSGQATDLAQDQRAAPRVTFLLRVAKLIIENRDHLCIMRDVSETGIRVRLFSALPAHREAAIEMGNGDRYQLRLVRSAGNEVAYAFSWGIDLKRITEEIWGVLPKRPLRLNLTSHAVLHCKDKRHAVRFRNISQQGASIECSRWLAIDELVRIEFDSVRPLFAKVRWRRAPSYGLVFEETFDLNGLAQLAAMVGDAAMQRSPSSS